MIRFQHTLLYFGILAALFSCTAKEEPKKQTCLYSFTYGTDTICLPILDGMNNYYPDTSIRKIADKLEVETNTIQAFYITDEVYNQAKQTGLMFRDNFLKIFTINGLEEVNSDSAYLEQVANSIETSNTFHDLKEIRLKLKAGSDFITPWQPLYMEKFTPQPGVRSFMMMLKYSSGTEKEILIGILNIMLIDDKLIGANYYSEYQDASTFGQARTKNDAIVKSIMEINK